jgi:hypothetical protein
MIEIGKDKYFHPSLYDDYIKKRKTGEEHHCVSGLHIFIFNPVRNKSTKTKMPLIRFIWH